MAFVARLKSFAAGGWPGVAVRLASLALVVVIGWTLARFAWLVIEGPARPVVDAPEILQPSKSRQFQPDMARGWLLFGEAPVAPVAPVDEAANAPQTRLALQLLGTFGTRDEKLAGAVIAEKGRDGELYRIGTSVPGGATLEKVEGDQVFLRFRGQLETLRFEVMSSGDDTDGMAGASLPGAEEGNTNMLSGFRAVREGVSRPASRATSSAGSGRDVFDRFESRFRTDPNGALGEFGLTVASTGSGYQVGKGAESEMMRKLGLRPGDVILSVNGNVLGDVQRDTKLIDQVKASNEARVEIRRGSQTFTVNYPLK